MTSRCHDLYPPVDCDMPFWKVMDEELRKVIEEFLDNDQLCLEEFFSFVWKVMAYWMRNRRRIICTLHTTRCGSMIWIDMAHGREQLKRWLKMAAADVDSVDQPWHQVQVEGRSALGSGIEEFVDSLLQRARRMSPLAKGEREAMLARITQDGRNGRLSEEELLCLARLSFRQLRRLKKGSLNHDDRLVIMVLQKMKEVVINT